jgi:succinate dehydrogenase / fumarate reductase, cytochrome b subunit
LVADITPTGGKFMKSAARLQSRPLSPHLQIYRPTMTMTMSIVHRITGAGLYVGTLLLAWWLIAAAMGPDAYSAFQSFIGSWLGKLVLLGYTWALIHHLLGGLRHFIWDVGRGFDLPVANSMARATLIGSILLTILVWIAGIYVTGAM